MRQSPPGQQAIVAPPPGEAESDTTMDRALHRPPSSQPGAESEQPSGVGQIELETVGLLLEARGQMPHEQHRSGAHDAQPEAFDVLGERIDTHPVDDGIGPGKNLQSFDG